MFLTLVTKQFLCWPTETPRNIITFGHEWWSGIKPLFPESYELSWLFPSRQKGVGTRVLSGLRVLIPPPYSDFRRLYVKVYLQDNKLFFFFIGRDKSRLRYIVWPGVTTPGRSRKPRTDNEGIPRRGLCWTSSKEFSFSDLFFSRWFYNYKRFWKNLKPPKFSEKTEQSYKTSLFLHTLIVPYHFCTPTFTRKLKLRSSPGWYNQFLNTILLFPLLRSFLYFLSNLTLY